MGEERLSALALTQCHRERVHQLDHNMLVDKSALKYARRMALMNNLEKSPVKVKTGGFAPVLTFIGLVFH